MWKKCARIVPPMNTSAWMRMAIAVKSTGKFINALKPRDRDLCSPILYDDDVGDIVFVSQPTIFIAPTPK